MRSPHSDSMMVWRTLLPDSPIGEIECRQGNGTAKVVNDLRESMLGMGEPFMMPSDSWSTEELTEADQGAKESLRITVVEVPGGE